jgi:RNA polymerase sigma factor (sigma-70 family)
LDDLADLVIRIREGDTQAFAEIVRRFEDMAVAYGYSLVGDFQLAEDAAQEAFLEAYVCLGQLREPAAFPGWFRRIVVKQCDRITRRKQPTLETLPAEQQAAPEGNRIEAEEKGEMKNHIWTAIDALPEHERAAVMLYYFSGYSQQEVSEFLGVAVTAVKKRLHSARRQLREMLMDAVADSLRERRPSRNEKFARSVIEMLNAARTGDAVRVRELLQLDRRLLTARNWLGNTALIMAVNSGHLAVAELLLQAGVKPDIHEAAAIGQIERVIELLAEDPRRLSAYSLEGFTPLGLSAHYGHLETTRLLLQRGADVNAIARHPLQVTPLHAALFGRQVETARLLIDHGADVNARRGGIGWPRAGWTALHYAAGYGFRDLIEPLLERGAAIDAKDDEGRTPVEIAIDEKQHEAAELLLRRGATK